MLIGNAFYQDSSLDPGAGYPMYYWHQTNTGLIYVRSIDDGGWVLVGDSMQPNLGIVQLTGAEMNGAITGSHGLSALDINNFTGSLTIGGNPVSSLQYANNLLATTESSILSSVAAAVASLTSTAIGARIAHATGTWTLSAAPSTTTGLVIDLPYYNGGVVQAVEGECIWGAFFKTMWSGGTDPGINYTYTLTQTAPRTYTATLTGTSGAPSYSNAAEVTWYIMAFKSS